MTKATGTPARARPAKARHKTTKITPRQREQAGEGLLNKHWRSYFLQALAATSNVSAAAEEAGVSISRAYKARREHPDFARQWREALLEGYEHLEMEVLGYLRDPDPKRKMDVANALRLLAAHRETVAKERAYREEEDEQAVLESIDAFIEDMRQRRFANEAILAEHKPEAGNVA
ncbi:MAG: hypothetical protein R3E18_07080 [Sphingomonadaceae bacterium]|nr:hypothetical protein [Sphingomonadaceae bacterium]